MTASDGFDLVVAGGTVVTPAGRRRAHLCIADGRIAAHQYGDPVPAARIVLDASGMLVLPGGVDTHVHLMDPGEPEREDFPHGTAAAAAAGVTTIIEHTHAWPVISPQRLNDKRDHLRGRARVDFGLAAHVFPAAIDQLPGLWRSGVPFFKIFTCSTHGIPGLDSATLFETFTTLARLGAPCLVHCEDDVLTASSERQLRSAGRDDAGLLTEWRTREAEALAVTQVCLLARLTGVRTIIAHASNAHVLEVIARERQAGAAVEAECCPQYFFLREHDVHEHGALRKFTPPARLRGAPDEQQMWAAFNEGLIGQMSSDHAPSSRAQKLGRSFWDAPFGLPGLDTTYPLLIDAALREVTSLERVTQAYCAQPARRFGLAGKGSLAPGNDADIAIVDPGARWVLTAEQVRSKAAWSPYEGRELHGKVTATLLRGELVYRDGALVGEPRGRFITGPGAAATGTAEPGNVYA